MTDVPPLRAERQRAVRRVLARDDLLTMAAAADRAVDIVRSRAEVTRQERDGTTLFDIALGRQIRQGQRHARWAMRAQALDRAAMLIRFGELVGSRPETGHTAEELHDRALAELAADDGLGLDRDMTIGVFGRYHAARNLRLAGRPLDAIELVKRPVTDLYGTGAEPHIGHYLYELGSAYIGLGRAADVRRPLMEWEKYWRNTRAAGYSTRHRFDFVRALVHWAADPADAEVDRLLRRAIGHLGIGLGADEVQAEGADGGGVRELSVLLATAEYLALGEHTHERVAEAVGFGARALGIADGIRARWRVLARSRAPLAAVFERVYGDMALLAQRLPGPQAAELGFRVAVSAKQTGFAVRIRDGQTFDGNPGVNQLVEQIVDIEASSAKTFNDNPQTRRDNLDRLRRELEDAVSPMLADTVFPPPADLRDLIRELGPRYALDYVQLRDTLDNEPHLFRTLIQPGGRMWFDLCEPEGTFRPYFDTARRAGDLAGGAARAAREVQPEPAADPADELFVDWRELARAVLPPRLTTDILADGRPPVQLVVSAHAWLSLVPWAALTIDDHGTRLVQRAVVTQTPVLTCLSGRLPPRVTGRALIRLVGRNERGVDVGLERLAWGFEPGTDGVRPHECDLRPDATPRPHQGRFDAALTVRDAWQFLHIASHGDGKGFGQYLDLPDGDDPGGAGRRGRLSAAGALALKWPTSILMASCHVGQVINDNGAEPLSFVMALLTGGARCVVAGIDQVDDEGTGRVAGHIVRAVRAGGVSLEVALRNAQLAEIAAGRPENGWALLSAYVR